MRTILVSAAVAMVLALFGTPLAIRMLSRRGYGQEIREDGPSTHLTKRGTPTMGGAVIVVATLIGYVVGHVLTKDQMSTSGVLVLGLMTGLGGVGFIDDFMKIYKQTSLGLRSGAKLRCCATRTGSTSPRRMRISRSCGMSVRRSGCCRSCCGSS